MTLSIRNGVMALHRYFGVRVSPGWENPFYCLYHQHPLALITLTQNCRSCVVDRIVSEKCHDEGVAYFYCDYSRAAEAQSAVEIVTSLLHQLLLQLGYIPEAIVSLCQDHRRQSSRPNLSEVCIYHNEYFSWADPAETRCHYSRKIIPRQEKSCTACIKINGSILTELC